MSDFLKKFNQKFSSEHYLAVDIGPYSIKALEIKKKGANIFIEDALTIPDSAKFYNGPDMYNINGIADIIHQIVQLQKMKTKKIRMIFSSAKLQSKMISIPEIPEKQLQTFVEFEYKNQFPSYNKLSDVLDYMPLGVYKKDGGSQNQLSVLLCQYPAVDATRVIKEFQNKKLFIDTIDVDVHSLGNTGKVLSLDDERDYAVFHVGFDTSRLVFLRGKTIVFSRNISFGFNHLILALQSQEDISTKDAASILDEYGLYTEKDITKGSKTIYADDYNEIMERTLSNGLNDVYRSFQFVNGNYSLTISSVYLVGELSKYKNAREKSKSILEVETHTWHMENGDFYILPSGNTIKNRSGKILDGSYAICFGVAVRGNFE